MRRILLIFLCVFLLGQIAMGEEQKISQAYENQLLERVRSVFSAEIPQEAVEHPICATPIFLEVKANWDKFSINTRKILQSYTNRPTFNFTEFTYNTPQEHFKIHYAKQGDSAVVNPEVDKNLNGVPDWVDTCAEVLEHVWSFEVNTLGYNQPPSDYWYSDTIDNGGDDKYDVYLLNLNGYLGYTNGEYFLTPQTGSATSYIVLDNDYRNYGSMHLPLEWLEVTFAHEFFHAIQMGYDAAEYEQENEQIKPYWMEMSAVWMEDMVYDGVNDYLYYLPSFFKNPEWSLKTFAGGSGDEALHAYGSCVWPIYLSERKYPLKPAGFDINIIKDIWTECGKIPGNNAIDYPAGPSATDIVLQTRGIAFEEAFREFTVWNYFTGKRARIKLFYSEGDLFPEVKADTHMTYPVDETSPELIGNLGSTYRLFIPIPGTEGGVKIDFNGHSADLSHIVSVLGYRPSPLPPFDTTMFLNPFNMTGTLKFYDWNIYNEVVMIPAVIKRNPNYGWSYEYQALYDNTLHGELTLPNKDGVLQNYPNPFVIKTESDITYFPFVLSASTHVRIDIFNVSGEKIRSLIPQNDPEYPVGEYIDKIYAIPWDGKNESGEIVSSGIYIYKFQTERTTVVKKLAVVR